MSVRYGESYGVVNMAFNVGLVFGEGNSTSFEVSQYIGG